MKKDTVSEAFFEAKYRLNPDFWNFESSPYEQARYAAMMNVLQGKRYKRAFEPGCSIGAFTLRLASLCDRVEATDISPTAVAEARQHCKDMPHVEVSQRSLPDRMPEGFFDLIVFSEIGYYFTSEQLSALGGELISRILPSGTLFATHWLGQSEDHCLTGDQVHDILGSLAGVSLEHSERHAGFRLDLWTRR